MNFQSGVPPLKWTCFYQEKGMEELRQSLMLTTMELENTRLKAEEELKMKDSQIIQIKYLLDKAIKEKDEAEDKCQRLNLEKLLIQQQNHQSFAYLSGNSSIEDEPRKGIDSNNGFSSSDCEESIVSSPPTAPPPSTEEEFPFLSNRALPEKGKLLEAVMKAGPLLQSLMLAGPLPEWRHPPPPLDTCQIPPPPLIISSSPPAAAANFLRQDSHFNTHDACNQINMSNCGSLTRKRDHCEEAHNSTKSKYQRLLFP